MSSYKVGDAVCLSEDREGIIRYIGKIKGKAGTFYGIELITGEGKHDGEYDGKRYFDCPPLKGIIVNEKQILFKLEDEDVDTITSKYSNSVKNKDKKEKSIQDLGSNFVIKRKPGPREIGRMDTSWQPPSWMKDFENDDNNLLQERSNLLAKKPYKEQKKQIGNVYIVGAVGTNEIFDEKPMHGKVTTDRLEHEKSKPKRNYTLTIAKPKSGRASGSNSKSTKLVSSPKNTGVTSPTRKNQTNKNDNENDETGYAYWKKGSNDAVEDDEEKEDDERNKKLEKELELEKQRKQRELELEKQKELELEKEREKQKELENQKQKELELQKQKKKELEELEKQKKRELEELEKQRQKQLELEKQRQKELELELERQRLLELEKEYKDEESQSFNNKNIDIHHYSNDEKTQQFKRKGEIGDYLRFRGNKESNEEEEEVINEQNNEENEPKIQSINSQLPQATKIKLQDVDPSPKTPPPRDYNIYFNMDIDTDSNNGINDNELANGNRLLESSLAKLFGVDEDRIIEIKTKPNKNNGFSIEFAVGIRTSLHPTEFIDVFDEAINEDKVISIISECYKIESPHIVMWEARYEKIEYDNEF